MSGVACLFFLCRRGEGLYVAYAFAENLGIAPGLLFALLPLRSFGLADFFLYFQLLLQGFQVVEIFDGGGHDLPPITKMNCWLGLNPSLLPTVLRSTYSSRKRCASSAAMQPVPALVIAWRQMW